MVLRAGRSLTLDELRGWVKERLASYKAPSELAVVAQFPRNAMGKVVKSELAKQLAAPPA